MKYSIEAPERSVRTKGTSLKVHFKNPRETAAAIKNRSLLNAKKYLNDVLEHKQAIPMRRYSRGSGRTGQVAVFGAVKGFWPTKSCKFLLDLLQNAESNAKLKGFDPEKLMINHIQVLEAPKRRRRTNRAHGRVTAYSKSPCHIQIFAVEKKTQVEKKKVEVKN